jgi:superfamily II DNA or RNA helicase
MTLAFLESLPAADAWGLRYYQTAAKQAVQQAHREGHTRTAAVMATGLGKTQLFSALAAEESGRVLVFCHRRELVQQAADRIAAMTGEVVGIEMANLRTWRERIVVASVQSLKNPARRERMQSGGKFSLLIVDELHHYLSPSYREAVEAFGDVPLVGVTATFGRGDGKSLAQITPHVCYEMNLLDGIDEGWLVDLVGQSVTLQEIDISGVRDSAGDLAAGQLDDVMLQAVEGVVKETLRLYPNRRGPIFFPGKASARLAFERFEALSPGSARLLTDDTPDDERAEVVRDIKAGRVQWLCNVMVATEGFDWPDADLVGLARPTKSWVLLSQMVGRGTRTASGVLEGYDAQHLGALRKQAIARSSKPDCVVLDFVGTCGKHELVNIVDLVAGDHTPAEVKVAKKKQQEEGGDPRKHLEDARAELRKMARAMQSSVKSVTSSFDVFGGLGVNRKKSLEWDMKHGYQPATPDQLAALSKAGLDVEGLSMHDAQAALTTMAWRRKRGMASPGQLKVLAKHGLHDRDIRFDLASKAIDYLKNNNWKGELETLVKIAKGRMN